MPYLPLLFHRALAEPQLDHQHAGVAAAEQGERAMRRHRLDGFRIVVVIAEFLFFRVFLAFHHFRRHYALVEQVLTQFAEQLGGLAELFREDVARAV